jgi:hypothetical protein
MKKVILGIVDSRSQAERIVSELRSAGIDPADISALLPDKHGTQDFAHEHKTKAPEGATTGAAAGGVLGGTLGLLAGIGALAIPGLGPLIAAGPLLAAMSGAGAGAAVGGLTGALVGLGIPELEAKHYEGKVKGGNILIAVHTEDSDEQSSTEDIMKENGAEHVSSTSEASVPKARSYKQGATRNRMP